MKNYGRAFSEISKRSCKMMVKVWEDFMGVPVPEDCCIHHLDQNPENNDILNLVCITNSEHARWHANHRSKETLDKMSKSAKNKKLTDEHKKKISESKKGNQYRKGKKLSEDHKKAISEFGKTRTGEKNGMFGKHHSKETIEKIGKSQKGKTLSEETKEKIRKSRLGKKFSKTGEINVR